MTLCGLGNVEGGCAVLGGGGVDGCCAVQGACVASAGGAEGEAGGEAVGEAHDLVGGLGRFR